MAKHRYWETLDGTSGAAAGTTAGTLVATFTVRQGGWYHLALQVLVQSPTGSPANVRVRRYPNGRRSGNAGINLITSGLAGELSTTTGSPVPIDIYTRCNELDDIVVENIAADAAGQYAASIRADIERVEVES